MSRVAEKKDKVAGDLFSYDITISLNLFGQKDAP